MQQLMGDLFLLRQW